MELYVLGSRRDQQRALVLPDGWVEDLRQHLRGTRYEGLVSRLDPYADAAYGGADLSVLCDGLSLYAARSARFAVATHAVREALAFAQRERVNVVFSGD